MKIVPAIFLLSFSAIAQSPAGIFGRVTNSQTHEPVRRAMVKVYTSKQQWDEFTDAEGRFKFPALARAEYNLIARRDGFTERAYKVELSDFDNPKELPIELRPQAVITGKVTSGAGIPLQNAHIQLGDSQIEAATNDLGEYRLSRLDPGTYVIRGRYQEGSHDDFDTTPVKIATATFGEVTVKSGETISGINFILDAMKPARIRGTLRTESGVFSDFVSMYIIGEDGGGHSANGRDGKFEIADVAPGAYTLTANAFTRDRGHPFWGVAKVQVGHEDVVDAEILMKPSPRIEGNFQIEGGSFADLKLQTIYFRATAKKDLGMNFASATIDASGNFTVFLMPADYTLSFDTSRSQMVSATVDGLPLRTSQFTLTEAAGSRKLVIHLKAKAAP